MKKYYYKIYSNWRGRLYSIKSHLVKINLLRLSKQNFEIFRLTVTKTLGEPYKFLQTIINAARGKMTNVIKQ